MREEEQPERGAVDLLEPQIERLLTRYRVPSEDAQRILDEVMLAMLTKRDRIRNPERWLMRTLKNRCLLYWHERRRRYHRVLDRGILSLLGSPEVEEREKQALREELRQLVGNLEPGCRDVLSRRYGLATRVLVDTGGEDPGEETRAGEEVMRCVAALSRRLSRRHPPAAPLLELLAGEGEGGGG